MRQRKNVYRRKIVEGFLGNTFAKIIEYVPGIVHTVAPITRDASKAFATGAASASGTAVGQKVADKIKGQSAPQIADIKQVISEIPPPKKERAMITTKKL